MRKGTLAGKSTVARRQAAVAGVSIVALRRAAARVSPLARSRVATSVSVVGPKAALSLKIAVASKGVADLQEVVASKGVTGLQEVAASKGVAGPQEVAASKGVAGPQEVVASKGVVGLQEVAALKGVAGPQEVVASRAGVASGRRAPKAAPGVTVPLGVNSTVGRAAGRAGSLIIVRVGRRRVKAALGTVAARESSGDSNTGAMGLGGVAVPAALTQVAGFVLGREARVRGAGLAGQVASSLARVRRVSGSRKLPGTDSANLG